VLKLTQSADVDQNGLGHSTEEGWKNLQKQLVSMGLMQTKIDVDGVFTNKFLAP